jgi:primosomal protein N' (replication factor Y)
VKSERLNDRDNGIENRNQENRYFNVAVTLPVSETFTYSSSGELSALVTPGKRVLVPFGGRRVTGYVLESCEPPALQSIKQILDVLDDTPLFPPSMGPFFKWVSEYYLYPIGEVIESALPSGLTVNDIKRFAITDTGKQALAKGNLSNLESDVLKLIESRPLSMKEIRLRLDKNMPRAFIQGLVHKDRLSVETTFTRSAAKPRLERFVRLSNSTTPAEEGSKLRKSILGILKAMKGEISVADLKSLVPGAPGVLKKMEEAGLVVIEHRAVYRDPFGDPIARDIAPVLTPEQDQVVSEIMESLGKGYCAFLLSGVTGSGKTEVYMRLAEETLKQGRQVLVMVPEIALISQVERRFRARFGDCIGVLHSGLSNGERYDQWIRISENQAPVVIGARSAVFAPLDRLGLLIVDEEHDGSYKQDHGLMYHGRDLAVKRARDESCVVVLGSATPSVQSTYNVETEKYREVTLTRRIEKRPLSSVEIVDLKETKGMRGIRKFFSSALIQAMKETLDRKEQALLFINRRGFSNLSVCGACGQPLKCQNCDITLTLHRSTRSHQCHYCGFARPAGLHCPICGSENIQHLGAGTEKIEAAVSSLFPEARVARMDRDTTSAKGSVLKILKGLKTREIDILIGTQMVAKGHDFPNITLVGVICADLSLSFPDFRSGARTFQLLAQVSGRAGRGVVPGRVILQTFNPHHFSIVAAKTQDFRVFYNQDIGFRKALKYPPFTRLLLVRISGKDSEETRNHAHNLGKALNDLQKSPEYRDSISFLGPTASALHRVANLFRWQILIKARDSKSLHAFMDRARSSNAKGFLTKSVKITLDVDPIFMM